MHDHPIEEATPDFDPIEAYLDGDLDALAERRFEARLSDDAALAAEVDLARRIRDGLRAMPRRRFPDRPIETPRRFGVARFRRRGSRRRSDSWRGALAAAALLAVAVFTGSRFFEPRTAESPIASPTPATHPLSAESDTPTAAEVEQARKELEIAFAYLGQLGRKAGAGVRDLGAPGLGATP